MPIAYCLLPFAYCLLSIAHCPLPIAHCLVPIARVFMPGGEPTALCRGASRQRYAGGRADSVMPSQRYAFPALCLIIPIVPIIPNKHRICLNMLYLSRFCSKTSFLTPKACFSPKKTAGRPPRKRQLMVCTKQPIVFKYQPI